MEILINAANILYVTAYFTMDMLRLRILTITAAACLAVYFLNQPVPMLNVVAWNVFFILLNLTQITRLLLARHRNKTPRLHAGERGEAPREDRSILEAPQPHRRKAWLMALTPSRRVRRQSPADVIQEIGN